MFKFKKISKINGLDINNPENAIQNSYAWSMAELDDYIYVGTSRNIFSTFTSAYRESNIPPSLITGDDDNAEIWRYRKDNCSSWEKVFETLPYDKSYGFRAMITHDCAIYAATMGENVTLFKSTDGTHWIKIYTDNLKGTSSRALASLNGKLYIATLEEGIGGNTPYLYSSADPEYDDFESVINTNSMKFMASKNPMGGIDDLKVFNNKLYVGISTDEGAELWRSNSSCPRTNDWTLVGDKGFGDSAAKNIMSSGIFKNHLYIAITKLLPLSLYAPFGFDLIRVDKCDNWELVVGGKPIIKSNPSKGKRTNSLSGFNSGFNNFFNIYGWQIKEYKDNLIITTCDASTFMNVLFTVITYNKKDIINNIGFDNYCTIIDSYSRILYLLNYYKYPKGFDIYTSKDGCHFKPEIISGFNNPCNYGGRTLLVSCENDLFLGTANPFCGCEVWKCDYINRCKKNSIGSYNYYFSNLARLNKELIKIYPALIKSLQYMMQNQNTSNN